MSPLYAIAVGVIPSVLAFAYQLNMHRQVPPGNRLLALIATIVPSAAWVVSIIVVVRNEPPGDIVRWVVVLGIALPSIYVFQKTLLLLWRWPWPPGKAQEAADRMKLPEDDL